MHLTTINGDSVTCGTIENYLWMYGNHQTCFMNETTRIDSKDFTIATNDDSVKGLYIAGNEAIKFLPIKIHESFPDLVGLNAFECSLTEVSYQNFAELSKLEELYLGINQIERIDDDTFKDLVSLRKLSLSRFG